MSDFVFDGSVTCVLCNGQINVKVGSFYKFQLHIENDHDVFRDQDLIMALSFLQTDEKEVIIEKVLPRMKMILDAALALSEKKSLSGPFSIHQRLSDFEEKDNSDNVTEPKDITTLEEEVENLKKKLKLDAELINEKAKFEKSDKEEQEQKNVELKNDRSSNKDNSKDENTRYSGKSDQGSSKSRPSSLLSKCPICKNMIKKYKFSLHKRNCQIMSKLNLNNSHMKENKSYDDLEKQNSGGAEKWVLDEDIKIDNFIDNPKKLIYDCDLCDKSYSLKNSLLKHTKTVHT